MKPVNFCKYLSYLVMIPILFLLTSCQRPLPQPNFSLYRPLSNYQRNLIAKINSAGGKVIKQGDALKVILPTDKFFKAQTTQVKNNKVSALEDVGRFVKNYTRAYARPTILVQGYTDTVFARKTRIELSKQYATVVAAYLWNEGINRNEIRIEGLGARRPIASNAYPAGAYFNRRVEIVVDFN